MRIRLLSGSFEFQPKIQAILTNAVYACNRTRYENEIAGSATGAPGQSVPIAHGPVLSGLQLSVNEGSIPPANELELMKKEGIAEPYITDEEAVWVKYREVENFYGSTPFSRHFVIDYKNNRIFFGDGVVISTHLSILNSIESDATILCICLRLANLIVCTSQFKFKFPFFEVTTF